MAVPDAEKADVLNTFFSSVFTRENTMNISHTELGENQGGIILTDIRVAPKAAQDKLSKLNPNKAQGPDQALVNNGLCHCVFFSTNPQKVD